MKLNNKPITLHQMVEIYGRVAVAFIVDRAVRRTIIKTQRNIRENGVVFYVVPRDPIPGRLEWVDYAPLALFGHDDKRKWARDFFYAEEIERMRKQMPNFDRYFTVRRALYAEED